MISTAACELQVTTKMSERGTLNSIELDTARLPHLSESNCVVLPLQSRVGRAVHPDVILRAAALSKRSLSDVILAACKFSGAA